MPRPRLIVAAVTPEELRDFLPDPLLERLKGFTSQFHLLDPAALTADECTREIIQLDPDVLIAAWRTPAVPLPPPPSLRYVCYLCGSVRKLITPLHLEAGLLVTNWGGSISRIVAEWALFHVLSCLRRATHWTLAMHNEGGWKNSSTETASLFGRRVGLHGFGRVARELVRLLQPFDTRVACFAPDMTAELGAEYGVQPVATLEELFATNDIIVELAPLNPSTHGIVREEHLRLIQPGGVFVNVGRGAVVDEEALLRVAREGQILVGLDVYGVEPLPPESPFRGLRNVCLTPHIAGPTTDRRRDAGEFAVSNIQAYISGAPLQAIVTADVYSMST